MDLSAIKKNIESGVIRTTAEFQRDIMLMFQNAVMYNSSDHDVYHMALEMQRDVLEHVQQFLATQLIMQTSESAISAKSLRGREGNRKPGEPAEKVGWAKGGGCLSLQLLFTHWDVTLPPRSVIQTFKILDLVTTEDWAESLDTALRMLLLIIKIAYRC